MNIKKYKSKAAMKILDEIIGRPMTLGSLLSAIREGEELSQVEFAKKIGISKSHLCDIEHDRKAIAPKKAKEYADILGYHPFQFVELAFQQQIKIMGLKARVRLEVKRVA